MPDQSVSGHPTQPIVSVRCIPAERPACRRYNEGLPKYKRAWVPGGLFFFTLVLDRRQPRFRSSRARNLLGRIMQRCQWRWSFTINALVLLPEHLHAIWSLPPGDMASSTRWAWIKREFTVEWLRSGGSETSLSMGRKRERRRDVWQPRFWEHTLESDYDFERHFDDCHDNPVKHGHVVFPGDWARSTMHRRVRAGVYAPNWACVGHRPFDDIAHRVGDDP